MHDVIHPAGWPVPRGYANGIAARGRVVFVAGQIGWDRNGKLVDTGIVKQTEQALHNVVAVLAAAGARPEHVTRMTWYVTDLGAYRGALKELGVVYRASMRETYPAMTLVQVVALLEPGACVEIEATAVIPSDA